MWLFKKVLYYFGNNIGVGVEFMAVYAAILDILLKINNIKQVEWIRVKCKDCLIRVAIGQV